MAGFHSHSLSADSGADVSEGGTGHQLGNCASNPEILHEMKAVYWLREIYLFWNVMELGWPWSILITVVFAAPSSLQWEGQERMWISLASWCIDSWKQLYFCDLYLTVQPGEERLSQWQTPEWRWDPTEKWGSVWKCWCGGRAAIAPSKPKTPGYCPRLLLPGVGTRVSEVFVWQRFLMLICRRLFGCVFRTPPLFANYFANSWKC